MELPIVIVGLIGSAGVGLASWTLSQFVALKERVAVLESQRSNQDTILAEITKTLRHLNDLMGEIRQDMAVVKSRLDATSSKR